MTRQGLIPCLRAINRIWKLREQILGFSAEHFPRAVRLTTPASSWMLQPCEAHSLHLPAVCCPALGVLPCLPPNCLSSNHWGLSWLQPPSGPPLASSPFHISNQLSSPSLNSQGVCTLLLPNYLLIPLLSLTRSRALLEQQLCPRGPCEDLLNEC